MTGHELVAKVREARERRDAIIARVCGACENKCCQQMTMMGTQDLRRLIRGMLLDPQFEREVREGLCAVADRLEDDLRVVREVTELLAASAGAGREGELAELRRSVEDWREFVRWLRSPFPVAQSEMRRLLMFSAIRSNTLNALSRFPGGLGALVNLSGNQASFQFRGRRIAPPPCLFYLEEIGCICGTPSPPSARTSSPVPNLLEELRASLGFDDVLANAAGGWSGSCDDRPRARPGRHIELKIILGALRRTSTARGGWGRRARRCASSASSDRLRSASESIGQRSRRLGLTRSS